jgi:tripartite-type tricarboxylate transporter receptor subunit TctC
MTLSRRRVLELATGAIANAAISRSARAQPYPTRPVRLVVGFPPGGPADIIARLTGRWLSERLSQQFVIENHPGSGSNLAAEAVVHALPDGYTLLEITSSNPISTTLYSNLSFDLIRDIVPIAGICREPCVMEVNPSVPAKTVPEFIAYAKANPGKLNMASGGIGTTIHVAGELFKMMTGIDMIHVPYHGSAPALTDLLGGQVHVMFDLIVSSIGHVRAGRLRALAVTGAARSEELPDVPTVGEFVPGYEASAWQGIGAPKGTPADIIDKLNQEINAGLADAKMKARLADLGAAPMPMTSAVFGKFIAAETEKWARVIRAANIKAE